MPEVTQDQITKFIWVLLIISMVVYLPEIFKAIGS